jgi:hypothetical protein
VRILCSLLFARSEETIAYFRKDQESNTENFKDKNSDETLEVVESLPLIEWFAENYKRFGTDLEIVTNKSQEGSQFCKGFGGIGGMFKNTYTHMHACNLHVHSSIHLLKAFFVTAWTLESFTIPTTTTSDASLR